VLVLSPPQIEFHTLSDAGPTRDNNEDHCAAVVLAGEGGSTLLLIVADGLGGHKAGEVASRLAVETVIAEAEREGSPLGERFLSRAVQAANLAVFNHGHDDPDCFNMQTTISTIALQQDRLLLAHVGDCRVFRVRQGQIQQLTTDHTRITEMLRMRLITPEQALRHPARNMLTRSLGADLILQVDTLRERALSGDIYVICTDGLWNEVSSEEIRRAVSDQPVQGACERLLALGAERGASDNMTIGVARVHETGSATSAAPRWKAWFSR